MILVRYSYAFRRTFFDRWIRKISSNITLNYLTKYWNKYWIIENWKLSVNVNDIHESKSKKKTVRIRNNKIFKKKYIIELVKFGHF